MKKKIWYAAMRDNEDDDWGTGSYDLEEARAMVKHNLDIYPDGYVAVIDESTANPVCIDEIREF